MIHLRPYQLETLEAIRANALADVRRQIVHLPTAAGKTVIFASLISNATKTRPGLRALILAFNCDLLGQARDKLLMVDPSLDVGILDANSKNLEAQVVVSSVQSARVPSNLERLKEQGFSIVIADECHHFASDTARHVLGALGFCKQGCEKGQRLLVGFSATPFRNDTKGLGEVFDKIVYARSIKEMIADGYLCMPEGKRILTDLDLSLVAVEGGDYSSLALSRIMNTPEINTLVVRSYIERAIGKKTIAFCTSIEHAVALADTFNKYGIFSEAIHSNLSIQDREILKRRFSNGDIEILTNPSMLTEGYDEPSTECVVIARPTKSPGLYQQMVGRGLRLFPGKQSCLVLDFSDQNHTLCNVGVLLEDIKTAEGRPAKDKEKEVAIADLFGDLPPNINPKLKKAILELDLLGESFLWKKNYAGDYYLKGAGDTILAVLRKSQDRYDVILSGQQGTKVIVAGLDFQYAFGAAEGFAKANRSLFVMSDFFAEWRGFPITKKQREIFRKANYKNGIDCLTRGQASQIIASGVLFRKKTFVKRT